MPQGDRTQPEFSLGERISAVEAELKSLSKVEDSMQAQIDRRLVETERLADEKLKGVMREISAINDAQKLAIDKAEQAAARQAERLREDVDRTTAVSDSRLGALERGESSDSGARHGVGKFRAETWVAIGALSGLALAIIYIIHG